MDCMILNKPRPPPSTTQPLHLHIIRQSSFLNKVIGFHILQANYETEQIVIFFKKKNKYHNYIPISKKFSMVNS